MKIRFLGTGTSSGVPVLGCMCRVCLSHDPQDKRMRCALLVDVDNQKILIDAGPDIRQQLLLSRTQYIDAVLITHDHFDHIIGLDELRPFSFYKKIPLYGSTISMAGVKEKFAYLFNDAPLYIGGGLAQFSLNEVEPYNPFFIEDLQVTPLGVQHGKLPILGFRIKNMAYLTDVKVLPQKSINLILDIDVLIINCLRKKYHNTHLNLQEALTLIDMIKPKQCYFIHMNHEVLAAEWEQILPDRVCLAYDGLELIL